jgi:hypothetical protein
MATGVGSHRVRGRRRRLLGVVLASIAVNAALGIYALTVPHFGELQGKVLETSGCVTGAGLLVLACLPALERRRLVVVPRVGIAASVLGFALLVCGAWIPPDAAAFWKTAGTILIAAAVSVLVSLLSLAELAPRYRPALPAAGLLAVALAGMSLHVVWSDGSSEAYARALGVVAVLLAATTVAVPILHRASRGAAPVALPSGGDVRFCPHCGRRLASATRIETTCTACGATFRVSFTTPRRLAS